MKKIILIIVVLVVALVVVGFVLVKGISNQFKVTQTPSDSSEVVNENLPENTTVEVQVKKDSSKQDTVLVQIRKLDKAYTSLAYEITYETQGIFQGVNSGSKPIDISGKDEVVRDVYLGTCSKNVCKPHTGVKSVSVALEFTEKSGKKSKFSQDFNL
jgi:hypothetical protein